MKECEGDDSNMQREKKRIEGMQTINYDKSRSSCTYLRTELSSFRISPTTYLKKKNLPTFSNNDSCSPVNYEKKVSVLLAVTKILNRCCEYCRFPVYNSITMRLVCILLFIHTPLA